MGLRTVILMRGRLGMLCYPHFGCSLGMVPAGRVARRACVVPGCRYVSPHCCVHCLVLREPTLCTEEPGEAHTGAHASPKGQGFTAHGAFSQCLRYAWNRSKLLEASPDFLCNFSSSAYCFLLMSQTFLLSVMVTWNLSPGDGLDTLCCIFANFGVLFY